MLVILIANAVFLGFNLIGMSLPTDTLRSRVIEAFATRDLRQQDWRPHDRWLGFNQYNDCSILLMALNRDTDLLSRSVGPVLTYRNTTFTGHCITLEEVAGGDPRVQEYHSAPYGRYWHGYVPLTAVMLQAVSVKTFRRVLKGGVYLSILLLLFAAVRSGRRYAPVLAILSAIALVFWAVPSFGQSPSHGPGDAVVMAGLAALVLWQRHLRTPGMFLPFCAGFGAVVVYFEFLTGQIPTAAGLLLPIGYLLAVENDPRSDVPAAWGAALRGLVAFGLGVALTVIVKQALVLTFVGTDSAGSFARHLRKWTGMIPDDPDPRPDRRILTPFAELLGAGSYLTYRSRTLAVALFGSAALAWIGAAVLAVRARSARSRSDFLAFAASWAVILVWIFVFSTHTMVHSPWMVRMLIVPIALGFGALWWQIQLRRELTGASASDPLGPPL